MITLHSSLKRWPLENKRVFLRTDFNVPLNNGTILNDFRLQAALPTIKYCLENKARLIIGTHMGRPTGYDESLSTKHLISWFEKQGLAAHFINDPAQAKEASAKHNLILLENLRFFPGEKKADPAFAQLLAQQAEYFIQDAFGTLHRHDASIALLPTLFAPEKRTLGFLVEKELNALNTLIQSARKPCVLIIGGGKVADKIPLLEQMNFIDTFLIGPAIANTFLKAQGIAMGKSLVDDDALDNVKNFVQKITRENKKIILPEDLVVAKNSLQGSLRTTELTDIQSDEMAITIGPKTAQAMAEIIKSAGTVIYNGLMGTVSRKETLTGAQEIFTAMAHSSATTMIAGGDSIAAAQESGVAQKITYLSSGGGATLTYLAGIELPGLKPFMHKD
jgi:phosphoglycerate kinase